MISAVCPKADNMQAIHDFAKCLGKDEKSQAAPERIPGRYWGKVNKQNILTEGSALSTAKRTLKYA